MAEEAPHKDCGLPPIDGQIDDAKLEMTETQPIEVTVAGEESWARQLVEKRNDRLIGNPLGSNLLANLARSNVPTPQKEALVVGDILVQDNHPEWSNSWLRNASRAKRTASAMASLLTFPPHSSIIDSQAKPSETWSRT